MAVVETRQDALTPQRKAAIEQEFRSPLSPRSPNVSSAVHATPPRAAARPLAVAYGAEAAGPFTPEPTKLSPAAQAVRAAVALACKGLSPFLRGAASPAATTATSSTRVHAPQFCPI